MKKEYKKPAIAVVGLKMESQVLTSSPCPRFNPEETYDGMD